MFCGYIRHPVSLALFEAEILNLGKYLEGPPPLSEQVSKASNAIPMTQSYNFEVRPMCPRIVWRHWPISSESILAASSSREPFVSIQAVLVGTI